MATEAMQPYNNIRINKIYLPFTSRGIFHILFNLIYLALKTRKSEGLFHITGDVHYCILVLPSKRTVLTIHDFVFLYTYKGLTRKILKWLYIYLPISKARWITTISEKSKQEIINHSSCDPDKITVITDPIDSLFVSVKGNARSLNTLGMTKGAQPRILFLGTKPNKNLELAIPALFQLPVYLRIIGELSYRQKKLLKKFRINHSSVFNISQEQLLDEYLQSDIILFPSTYEGFGLPVIEAFGTGKPIITSNISPMKEVAGSGAILVDPTSIASIRDAIRSITLDTNLREQIIAEGKKRILDFLPIQVMDQYRIMWDRVLESESYA